MEDYVGHFEHPAYGIVEINVKDNRLFFTYGKTAIPLLCKSAGVFTGQFRELLSHGINPNVDFTFIRNSAGKVYKVDIPFEGFRSALPITFTRK